MGNHEIAMARVDKDINVSKENEVEDDNLKVVFNKLNEEVEEFKNLDPEKAAEIIIKNPEKKEKIKTIFKYAVAAGFLTVFVTAPILVGLDSKIIHDITKALGEGGTMLAGLIVFLGTCISTTEATLEKA